MNIKSVTSKRTGYLTYSRILDWNSEEMTMAWFLNKEHYAVNNIGKHLTQLNRACHMVSKKAKRLAQET